MTVWMGEKRLLSNSTVICLALYFYSWQFRTMGLAFKDAAGMWKSDFWKPYVGALINILLNVILIHMICLNGVLIATIIDLAFIYFPWETRVLFRDLFATSPKLYYERHISYFAFILFVAVVTYFLCYIAGGEGVWKLMIDCVICLVVPNFLAFIRYRKTEEFNFLWSAIVRYIKGAK